MEITSDNVPFNQLPKMKAAEITKAAKDAILSKKYDYVRLNFANGDMVGHTGDMDAVLVACEAVDKGVKVSMVSTERYPKVPLGPMDLYSAVELRSWYLGSEL